MIFSDKFFASKIKLILGLLLPAILLYYKSTKFDFSTLDEQWLILKNPDLLQGWLTIKNGFEKSLFGLYYRPMLVISIFIDYKIGTLSPYTYHLTNLLFHLLSILLLYNFLRLNKVSKQIAFFSTIIFSVHPILLHAVAWVPGRNDSLLFIFSIASVISFMQFLVARKNKFIYLHFLFFICALLTKETAIILPLIYGAVYFVHAEPRKKELGLFFTGWVFLAAAWVYARNTIVEVPMPDSLGFVEVLKNFVSAMLLYTGKALIPVNQSILPLLRNSTIIPGVVAMVIVIGLWFKPGIKDKKIAGLGLFIFFMVLALPVWFSSSKNGGEHYEHRLYTAMAGMMLFFSQLKFEAHPKISRYVALVVFCLFCIKTYTRMDVYKNNENFIDAGIAECDGNYIFLNQKAQIYYNQRNFLAALDLYDRAIAINPDKAGFYSNRAAARYELGYYKSAVADFSKAIKLNPKPECQLYLGRALCYVKSGDTRNAVKDLAVTKTYCPSIVPPEAEKLIIDKWTSMFADLDIQIKEGTTNAKVYYERALLYFDTSREKEGLADLSKACALAPENKEYLKLYMERFEKQK